MIINRIKSLGAMNQTKENGRKSDREDSDVLSRRELSRRIAENTRQLEREKNTRLAIWWTIGITCSLVVGLLAAANLIVSLFKNWNQ